MTQRKAGRHSPVAKDANAWEIAAAEDRGTANPRAYRSIPDVRGIAGDLAGVTMCASTIGGPSLAEQYLRWKRTREIAAAKASGAEAAALAASRRRIRKRVKHGHPPARALADGFARYQNLGGRLSMDEWARQAG